MVSLAWMWRQQRTGSGFLQERLQATRELDDVLGGPRPKDQTVSGVREAWFQTGVLQPQEERVNEDLLEGGGEKLVPLLAIAGQAVCRIQ